VLDVVNMMHGISNLGGNHSGGHHIAFALIGLLHRDLGIAYIGIARALAKRATDVGKRRRIFAAMVISYILWYLGYAVHRVKLDCLALRSSDEIVSIAKMKTILQQCPALTQLYWPTIFAPTRLLQILLSQVRDLLTWMGPLQPNYRREFVVLSDRQTISVDWLHPARTPPAGTPVIVCFHGAFQGSISTQMADIANMGHAEGMPVIIINRRGYGTTLTVPKVNLSGFDEDTDEVLQQEVSKRYPGHPIALVGYSAGSLQAVRYAANRGAHNIALPQILCAVGLDFTWDMSATGLAQHCLFPYNYVLSMLCWYTYAYRGARTLKRTESSAQAVCQMSPKNIVRRGSNTVAVDQTRILRRFSGSKEWDSEVAPMGNIKVPCLLINSSDDPLCVPALMDQKTAQQARSNPWVASVVLRLGSHGAKYGLSGFRDPVHTGMIREFILAAWHSCSEIAAPFGKAN